MPGAHQSHSIIPSPQLDRGEKKYDESLVGQDKENERVMGKTD